MSLTEVTEILQEMLFTTLLVIAPMLLTSLAVGLGISIVQAATQINEQTLTFIPKLMMLVIMLIVAGPWMLQLIMNYTITLFHNIPSMIG